MARHPKDSTPKLTPKLIEEIAQTIQTGAYIETAVALAGISKDTFYRWLRQAESNQKTDLTVELSYAVRRASAEAELRYLEIIDQEVEQGNWKAAAWRLERRFPQKWGKGPRNNSESSDESILSAQPPPLTDEELSEQGKKLLKQASLLSKSLDKDSGKL